MVSYEELMNGNFIGIYHIEGSVQQNTFCGYTLESYVRLRGTEARDPPLFFSYEQDNLNRPYF